MDRLLNPALNRRHFLGTVGGAAAAGTLVLGFPTLVDRLPVLQDATVRTRAAASPFLIEPRRSMRSCLLGWGCLSSCFGGAGAPAGQRFARSRQARMLGAPGPVGHACGM